MSDYTYQDLLRMQEEAKARVMEMQRRSRFLTEEFDGDKPNSECGMRNAEFRQEPETPRGRRVGAIRMPVELPEANAEFGMRNSELRQGAEERREQPSSEFGIRSSELRQGTGLSAALKNVFGSLGEEETEKMFLLALCLLLHQENGDEGLLLAMMYLLT